jgi:CDP-diglyceride synthetase
MNVPYNFFGVQFQNHFDNTYLQKAWWLIISIIAISLTFFSILGDLLFSWFKRKNHIKDFGSSLPGHGGYLDRIDSFVVVIAVFTIITFVISIGTTIYNHDNFHLIFPNWYK